MGKAKQVIEVTPTDQSPDGIEELAYILNAVIFEGLPEKEVNSEEELRQALKEYLARPEEERRKETLEIAARAKQRFREMKERENKTWLGRVKGRLKFTLRRLIRI